MVRQPILVSVDPYEVLKGKRHPGLLVRLQLGHVDEYIPFNRCGAKQVLLDLTLVMVINHPGIVIRTVVVPLT